MKKAILIEPELLAKIKRNSPAIYEYYCNSPFTRIEFVDYGILGIPMYMPKEVMCLLDDGCRKENVEVSQVMLALQVSYAFGKSDMVTKYAGNNPDPVKMGITIGALLNHGLNYPYYDITSLLNPYNYEERDGVMYNKTTYKEAQYFEAWNGIFSLHEIFNDLFIDINATRKEYNMDNMGIKDFSTAFN